MNIRPLQDGVLIQPIEASKETKSGIIIPDSAKEKPMEGKVKAVGEGKMNENGTRTQSELKEGNKVLYGKYSGTEIKIDGADYLLMKENDILAICES